MSDHPLPPFQAFLDEHRRAVFAFLVVAVGPHDADDCFQETFIAALRAYSRLSDGRNLRAWVLKIAQRKAIDHHRARGRRPVPVDELPEGAATATVDGTSELWRAVRALPTKQRAAVAHRFVGDLPYREIALVMSCSEAAARRSVHEGLKTIRREWSE